MYFSIGELSQDLKSDVKKVNQTSLKGIKFGRIMKAKVLHATEGFRPMITVFRLKLKRAWRAFCRSWSTERVKFSVMRCKFLGKLKLQKSVKNDS